MSLFLSSHARIIWPPLKRTVLRPAAREYRSQRRDKKFDRYWNRLMRRHRRFTILRRLTAPPRTARLIPSEFGDQAFRLSPSLS